MSAREGGGYSAALMTCIPGCLGSDIYTGGGVKAFVALLDCNIAWSSKARCSAR